jgi:PAS domain S-box-containing protein
VRVRAVRFARVFRHAVPASSRQPLDDAPMNMTPDSLQHENTVLLGQMRILEMVATAAPLADTLTELTRFIEAQEPGVRCGILVVADDGEHFRCGYGPSLPETYHLALGGARITSPYLGPCAQVAHEGVAVVLPDIAHDDRWASTWRELALSCGLAACRSTPVRAADGSVLASFSMYYDHPRAPNPAYPQLIAIATHLASIALEGRRADAALRENKRSNALLATLPVALYTTDAEGRITFYNEAAVALWGGHPELGQTWCGSWRMYWPDGRPMPHDQCPMAVALKEKRALHGEAWAERPDGTRVPFLAYPSPLLDDAGVMTGAVNMLVDITARKHAEEQRVLLVNELNHRVKNTLSAVQSIALQTLRSDGHSVAEALNTFEARLFALSKTHDALTRNSWMDASLRQLLEQELAPYCGNLLQRCSIEGADFRLTPKTALALGMAFHELATNASKYGALSCPTGLVRVTWSLRAAIQQTFLCLVWAETGGLRVRKPQRRGFGSRLIEHGLAHELDGEVRMDFEPTGLICTVEIPLEVANPKRSLQSAEERIAVG